MSYNIKEEGQTETPMGNIRKLPFTPFEYLKHKYLLICLFTRSGLMYGTFYIHFILNLKQTRLSTLYITTMKDRTFEK